MATPVKPNESDSTSEPATHEARPTPHQEELPELGVRILSDFARIVAAEARLLESNIVEAAESFLDRLYLASILIVLVAAGIVAILASLALLLHHWMRWWQVMGVLGVGAIIVAGVLRYTLLAKPLPKALRSTTTV